LVILNAYKFVDTANEAKATSATESKVEVQSEVKEKRPP
jgi:hypothetical protein